VLSYVIPLNSKVKDIIVTGVEKTPLDGTYYVFPAQPPRRTGETIKQEFVKPDQTIYSSATPIPNKIVELRDISYVMGYQIVTVNVYPIEYIPSARKINLLSAIRFSINYEIGNVPIKIPPRISETRQKLTKDMVRSMIENKKDLEFVTGGIQNVHKNSDSIKQLISNQFPFNLNVLPDYLIITINALKPAFQQLADWETKKGIPALIVTFENDINGKYPGIDTAEKIRNYLIDVTTNQVWGYGYGLFVLLGGDYHIIPARLANLDTYDNVWKPTDLYYATVNGDWNANGNQQFGESQDQVDESQANFVGRVPVSNAQDVQNYTNKVIEYETLVDLNSNIIPSNFLSNDLILGANLGGTDPIYNPPYNTSCDFNSAFTNACIPSDIQYNKWRLYDDYNDQSYNTCPGDEELSRNNAIDRMSNVGAYGGYNFIMHCDHSGPYTLGASVNMKDQSLTEQDIDGLSNGSALHILFTNGCDPGRFEKDCIVSHDIKNANGGAVLAIANAGTGWQPEDFRFSLLLNYLYCSNTTNIVHAYDMFKNSCYMGNSYYDNGYYKRKWTLFGDPALQIWDDIPNSPLTVTPTPATLVTGQNNISLTITGLRVGFEAEICFLKDGEVYHVQSALGTGNPISVNYSCIINTIGQLTYKVTARQYLPVEGNIPVIQNPNDPNLYISAYVINDGPSPGVGNQDHQPDAGETIDFPITLTNDGIQHANNVVGILSCSNSIINILQPTSSFGNIPANGTSTSNPDYLFQISNNAVDNQIVDLHLALTSPPYQGDIVMTLHSPVMSIKATSFNSTSGYNIINPGDDVDLTVSLNNTGSAVGTGIVATLSTTSLWVDIMSNSQQSYGDIQPYSNAQNTTPYHFHVVNSYGHQELDFTLTIVNSYGKTWVIPLNLNVPAQIQWGGFTSTFDQIDLYWTAPTNFQTTLQGYNIYRSSSLSGPYTKLNSAILPGSAFYNDYNLPPLTTYYYEVSAVSLSGVEGPLSIPLEAWTSFPLQSGWPIDFTGLGYRSEGSPMTFDVNGDSKKEVFMSTEDINGTNGSVLGYNSNGTKLFPSSASGFYQFDCRSTATPAIADVDQDGKAELLVTTRDGANNLSTDQNTTFCFSTKDADPNTGLPLKKWSTVTGRDLTGDVLADYNNDGLTEVSLKGEWGSDFYVLNGADGSNFNGWPIGIPSNNATMSIPVVADLFQTGHKNYIIGIGNNCDNTDGIYVWSADGNPISNNPDGSFFEYYNANTGHNDAMDAPIAVADINNDGKSELICVSYDPTQIWYHSKIAFTAHLFVLDNTGNCISGWGYNDHTFPVTVPGGSGVTAWLPAPSVGDINNDGHMEVVIAEDDNIYAWDYQGNNLPFEGGSGHFPIPVPGLQAQRITPLLADIDGDNEVEIVVASNNESDGKIFGYKLSGQPAVGFPINCGLVYATPCIDDIDNDGKNEIIACSGTKLYVWKTPGRAVKTLWGKYRLNANNNAVYDVNCNYNPNSPITISSNETWTNETYVNSDIIIEPGATLTVVGKVFMVPQSRIIVQQGNGQSWGGKLIINGGKITSNCTDFWMGIEVWGQYNQKHNAIYQGTVNVLNNGEIDNAEIGILCGKRSGSGFDDTYAGGIVTANEGIFTDNGIGIDVRPYTYSASCPTFTSCQFSTTPFINDINQFASFITVTDNTSVSALGCSFINSYSTDPYGTGINVSGSGINVGAWCSNSNISPCPTQDLVRCTFTNLTRGIYAVNTSGYYPCTVSSSDFYSVQSGVYLSAYTNATVVSNTFTVPEPAGGVSIVGPYGMYLDNCTQYHVEGNTFQSTSTNPTTIGLIVNNSGTDANVIYRNTFLGLKYSTIAQYANRDPYPNTDGLCYVCNTFNSTTVSIGITFTGSLQPNYGIADYQNAIFGGNIVPVFNLFHDLGTPVPKYDIYDANCNPISQYLYPQNSIQPAGYSYFPWYRTINVSTYSSLINPSNQCPNTINNGGGSQTQDNPNVNNIITKGGITKAEMDSVVNKYTLRNTLNSYFDLAFFYLQQKEVGLAQSVVADIPSRFSLTSDNQKDYLSFKSLFNIVLDLRKSSTSILNLSSGQISELEAINDNSFNCLGAYARNLLIASKEINYREPIILPVFTDSTMTNNQGGNGSQPTDGYLKVHPNPANTFFVVDYNLSTKFVSFATLKVFNSLGKLINIEPLTKEKGQIMINSQDWAPGIYLVSIEIEGSIIASDKISITR